MTFTDRLLDQLRARIRELDLERQRLVDAEQALLGPAEPEPPAPYGLKADGTPRKRPAPTPETIAKAVAARRANGQLPAVPKTPISRASARGRELRIRQLSSTHPTPAELAERDVRWTTEAPG